MIDCSKFEYSTNVEPLMYNQVNVVNMVKISILQVYEQVTPTLQTEGQTNGQTDVRR